MQKRIEPQIRDYMVRMPVCIGEETSLQEALGIMKTHSSRYLPVISGSKVVGILKESPAKMASRLLGSEDFTAGDVMQVNPYVTQPEASLYEVLDQTPSNPYGCTVVQNRKGEVVGMFTPNELMKTVHRLVEEGR